MSDQISLPRSFEVDLELARQDQERQRRRTLLDKVFTWAMYGIITVVFFTPMIWSLSNSFLPSGKIWENVAPVSYKTFLPLELNLLGRPTLINPDTGRPYNPLISDVPDISIDPARGEPYSHPETGEPYINELWQPLYRDAESGALYVVPPRVESDASLYNYATILGLTERGRVIGYNMGRNMMISLLSAAAVVALSLVFNTMAAYFFGRLRFPGKPIILMYVVVTMMIPQQVVLVPLFLVADAMNLTNTFWALVLPFYASPFIAFALAQFMADLPYDLDEAAIMDGANLVQILFYVILPNTLPGLLTVSLLEFQFIWNAFEWPLVVIQDRSLIPLQVAMAGIIQQYDTDWGQMMAAVCLGSVPVIVLFMFMQRFYYDNIALTGIK